MDLAIEDRLVNEGYKQKNGPLKLTTLRRYLISLSVAHKELGLESPTKGQAVKMLLRRAKQAAADKTINKKAAITKGILTKILATCDDSLVGVRDRAVLLVGFTSGGRRRDELAKLRIEDLSKVDGGYLLYNKKE